METTRAVQVHQFAAERFAEVRADLCCVLGELAALKALS
jgi:hypothetical protein